MMPTPPNVALVKTSHGTWVALDEEWSVSGELLALHPRRERDGAPILQKRERRQLLLIVLSDATQADNGPS
jgi:hypothetical protein